MKTISPPPVSQIGTVLVVNALNGTLPLVLRNKYPHAKITCAEVFPFYKHHLRNLGFEVTDWEGMENMKFDIIVGNPPYQNKDTNMKGNLWSQFILQSAELINEDGYIAIVCPPSWMSGTDINGNAKKKALHDFFTQNDILHLNLDVADHFPGIGSKFTYFVIQKKKTNVMTTVVSNGKTDNVDLSDFKILPKVLTSTNLSIVNKFIGHPEKKSFTSKGCVGYPKPLGSGLYTVYNTGSSMASSDTLPANASVSKVVVSVSGNPVALFDDGQFGCSINSYWTEVSDKQEGELYVQAFQTKLVRWVFEMCKYSGFNNLLLLKLFPKMPDQIADQDLYVYFKLTKKEVKIVEQWA